MASNEETNAAGTDTRPPMLVESDYDSWKIRIHRYIRGKPNGKQIWKSIQNGPTPHPMITDPPTTDSAAVPAPRKKLDSEFSEEENKLEDADTQAEIILVKEDFQQRKEDCLNDMNAFVIIVEPTQFMTTLCRFHKLVSDTKNYSVSTFTHQMNTKFVNNLPAYWGKYVTNVKQNMDISTTPYYQFKGKKAPVKVGNTWCFEAKVIWVYELCRGVGHLKPYPSLILECTRTLVSTSVTDYNKTCFKPITDCILYSDEEKAPIAAVAFMANFSSTSATNNSSQRAQTVPTEVSADTSDKVSMIAILTDLQTQLEEHAKIFDDLEAEYEQCVLDNKNLTIEKKNLLIRNDCLIAECLEKDICSIVLTSDIVVPPSSNCLCEDLRSACDREHTKVLELEAEISKQKQLITESEKRFAFLEQNYVSLQLKFQNYKQCIDTSSASNAIFEINKLRQQLQGKDDTIRNLDAQISIMKVSKGRTVADSIAERLIRPTAYKFQTDCSIIPCIDTSSASNAIFEINKLRQQLQGKDDTIRNLDAQINIMKVLNVGSTEGSCDQQALETDRIQLKDTITSLRIQLDGLKVENVSLKRRYDELSQANTHSRTAYTEKLSALTSENTKLKALVHGKTSSGPSTSEKPKVLASGMYTNSSKYIPPPKRANWVKPTPLPKKKQVTFQEPPRTSNRPTQKPPVQQNKKPNVSVNLSTRTKPATESRKPMPKSHTRNHHILPNKSVNARRAAYHNRKLNVVDHNQFVIRSLKSVNTKTPQAKHSVNHTKKVWNATRNHNVNTTKTAWRPIGKVVGSVKPQWKPTGRHFALYDNCPLTRIMEPIVEPLELTPSVSSSSKVTMISRFTDCKLSDRKAGSKGLSGIFEC
ncbi:hypothetical protein Tco_1043764 [Tanacetum coccineum]|uniref:Uncharacterized protein n=1 Tax=Tanacetum coccineum TaxID=301880 RepID=A0ABQ5GNZ4_9ASTR